LYLVLIVLVPDVAPNVIEEDGVDVINVVPVPNTKFPYEVNEVPIDNIPPEP
jgi:hypothetical protein